ncbi:MAG: hypothetical protein JSV08_06115 [Acidobacteriota bacterium]|nr:MAG: hypothetical protein JSV08_06115 [Acidobacteriota bacterium]
MTLALVACTKFFLFTFDFLAHHAFIGTIAHGNFPVMYPYAPDEPLAYFYGFDLLAALPYRAAGWGIGFVAGMVGVWVFLGAALAVVGFQKAYFSARPAVSVVGVLFYFFGSSITGVAVVLAHAPPGELKAYGALPYIQFSHGLGRSVGYALLPVLLLLVEAFWKRRLGSSLLPWFVLVACLMASLGLTAPELLAVLGLAMVVVALKDIWRGKEGGVRKAVLVGVLALSLVVSFLQGGFLTSGFFSSGDENVHLESEYMVQPQYKNVGDKFYLMWPPAIPTWSGYAGIFSPMFWRVALLEFGPLFLLFPYFLKPGGDSFKQILMLAVCVSLGVPCLVGYGLDEFNMSKFFHAPMLVVHLFASSFLVRLIGRWVTRPFVRRISLAVLVSVMILTPVGYWTGHLWLHGSRAPYKKIGLGLAVDSEIEAVVSDLKRRVPPLARILAASDFIYPLHSNGYFALHDPPSPWFFLGYRKKEAFDASLKLREKEDFLAWRPDYLLVPEDVLRHFQAVLPEASTRVLRKYAYSRRAAQEAHAMYLVKVRNP